jgi:predicted unusual protein kinase regulating ubiquinone biosynthesis (AarF/ABC1/UbiB family)
MDFSDLFHNLFFICEITAIFFYEYVTFLFNKNYTQFIKNITTKLSKKNIMYVKIFQAISLNNSFIDDTLNAELIKYTDSVPYSDDDIDKKLLEDISRQFSLRLTTPINSGMISLVYKTRSVDKDVIIKVKRKNIDQTFDDAIKKLMFFIKILSYIPQINFLNIPNIVNKNISLLHKQLDFEEEVKNTIEMKNNCANLKYIKIPFIHETVTKMYPNVIMMEFIEGLHITKISDDEFNEYAKLVIKYGVVSLINDSVTHGDLHAGNVIFIKNNEPPMYQLGLIDFGIVTRIEKNITRLLLNVASNLNNSTFSLSEMILNDLIEPRQSFLELPNKDFILNEISNLINETLNTPKNMNQVRLFEGLKKVNHFFQNHKMHEFRINDDFVKLQMALAMSQGLALHLCKNDYLPFAKSVMDELFHINI